MTHQIKWKRTAQEAVIPTKAHPSDAGMDMRVLVRKDGPHMTKTKGPLPLSFSKLYDADLGTLTDGINVLPNQTVIFHTGLKCAVPEGYYLEINPRSSLGFNKDIMLANTVGVIDANYRGPIMVALHNNSTHPQTIEDGDRVVQCMLKKVLDVENVEVDELDDTDRGVGGIGSTGVK